MLNTNQKILIARFLCACVLGVRRVCALPSNVTKTRGGIKWTLDLKEGIDLAIYVLGGFEVRTLRKYQELIKKGDVVLDIGANIGAHTLPLAKLVGGSGKVIAFEPTVYAFKKLEKNIQLNPALMNHILTQQTMLVKDENSELPDSIYSSWPLESSSDLHKDHGGRLMATQGAKTTTLDSFVKASNLSKLDVIKLDVDGNEYDVLMGGSETLKQFKPTIFMELAPFVYASKPKLFDDVLLMLWELNYKIVDIANNKELPRDPVKARALIPPFGGMNVLITKC